MHLVARKSVARPISVSAALALSVVLVEGAYSGDVGQSQPNERPQVRVDDFARLRAGLTKLEVDKLLRSRGEHKFTFQDDKGHVWAVGYYEIDGWEMFLLYRDERLIGLCDHDISAGAGPPNAFDDDSVIKRELKADWIRGDEVERSMDKITGSIREREKKLRAIKRQQHPDPGLIRAFSRTGIPNAENQAQFERAYKENAECAKKFDSWKIRIGMSRAQMDAQFGTPLFQQPIRKGEQIVFYGPKTRPSSLVSSPVACWPFMVMFRNDKAVRVISHGLFNSAWESKIWPKGIGVIPQ
jgi:hypothetical protein